MRSLRGPAARRTTFGTAELVTEFDTSSEAPKPVRELEIERLISRPPNWFRACRTAFGIPELGSGGRRVILCRAKGGEGGEGRAQRYLACTKSEAQHGFAALETDVPLHERTP
eukprot:9035434-Alexandrium_andersonii.AAC.1